MAAIFRSLALCAFVFLVISPVLGACGFSPNIADGSIGCSDGGLCPPGFSCASDGECHQSVGPSCGGGLPCAPGRTCTNGSCVCTGCDAITSDGCDSTGGCQCGTGAACQMGQHCVGGQCTCDSTSCASGC